MDLRFAGVVVAVAAVSGASAEARQASPSRAVPTVLFMCPHGAAKSVLASAHFRQLAKERGLDVRVDFAGTEPDAEIGPAVAARLAEQGLAAPAARPRRATAADMADADVVVSIGCDLSSLPPPRGRLLRWDEVPPPGEDLERSEAAIRARVVDLVEEMLRNRQKRPVG